MMSVVSVRQFINYSIKIVALFFAYSSSVFATDYVGYQAQIIAPDGKPLAASSVQFILTYRNAANDCTIYREQFTNVDMSQSAGLVVLKLGNGNTPIYAPQPLKEVFNNQSITLNCEGGGSKVLSASENRVLFMQFNDGTGWQTISGMNIESVPYAWYADDTSKFAGLLSSDFTKKSDIPGCNPGEVLTANASGDLTCVVDAGGAGTVTSVTASGPLASSGGATPNITITQASGTTAGYLSSSDWTTFSNKLANFSTMTSVDVTSALGYTPTNASTAVTSVAGRTGAVTLSSSDISGLGNAAGLNVGTGAGTVAAGNDARLTDERTPINDSVTSAKILDGTIVSADLSSTVSSGLWTVNGSGDVSRASGKVGIGTTTPQVPLHVVGTMRITQAIQDATNMGNQLLLSNNQIDPQGLLLSAGDSLNFIVDNNNNGTGGFNFRKGTTNPSTALPLMTILNSGNVGVGGLTNPSYALDVSGDVNVSGNFKINGVNISSGTVTSVTASSPLASSGGATPNITITQASGTTAGYLSSSDWTTFSNKLSDFSTLTSSDITGKLGYVPVNPATAVTSVAGRTGAVTLSSSDISGLGNAAGLNVGTGAGTVAAGNDARFTDQRTPLDNSVTSAKILDGTITSADLSTSVKDAFWSLNASGDVSRMSGNVGIGTATPSAQLHLATGPLRINDIDINRYAGKLQWSQGLVLGAQSSYTSLLTVNTGSGNGGVFVRTPSSGAAATEMIAIKDYTTSNSIFNIRGDGKIGVGIVSPSYAVDVSGDVNVTGAFLVNGAPINSGTVTSVSSANADIGVATGTTTPVLTLNSGVGANQIVKLDGSGKLESSVIPTNIITSSTTLSGDVSGTLSTVSVDKLKNTALNITALTSGNFLKYNGTNWVNANIGASDLRNNLGNQQFANSCSSDQTMTWSSITDSFACTNISISSAQVSGLATSATTDTTNAANITSGTIDAARLPASVKYWDAVAGGINYAGGNVGIGTATPDARLDITAASLNSKVVDISNTLTDNTGTLKSFSNASVFSPTTASTAFYMGDYNQADFQGTVNSTGSLYGSYSLAQNTSAGIQFGTIYGVRAHSKNSSNVIAGTANLYGLSVLAHNASAVADSVTNAYGARIDVNGSNTSTTNAYGIYIGNVRGVNKWSIYAPDAIAPSYFAGNVGLGSTTPAYALDVSGDVNVSGNFRVNGVAIGAVTSADITAALTYTPANAATAIVQGGNSFATVLNIGTNDSQSFNFITNGTQRMQINSGGNIGIGGSSSGSQLTVTTPGTDALKLISTWGGVDLSLESATGVKYNITTTGAVSVPSDTFVIHRNGTAFSSALVIDSSNNVGIGNGYPASKLDVSGALSIQEMVAPTTAPLGSGRIYFDSTSKKFRVSENNSAYVDLISAAGDITAVNVGSGLSGGGTSGDVTISLGTELLGLSGLATNGFVRRTAAGTYSTAASIDLTNSVTGALPAANGGTGQNTYVIGDILYASSSSALSRLPAGTSGYVLQSNGAGTAPSWVANSVISDLNGLTDVVTNYTNNSMFLGTNAGAAYVSGNDNTAIGEGALSVGTTGMDGNTAVGYNTLRDSNSGLNTAVGAYALLQSTGGYNNTAIGHTALSSVTNQFDNVAIGYSAGENIVSSSNIAIGAFALQNHNGSNGGSIGIGKRSLLNATGMENLGIGTQAGDNITTGNYNIIIGSNVDAPSATADYQLNIGNAIYGDLSTGYIAIGAITPSSKLHVDGDVRATSFISTSDRRLKTDIQQVDGLNIIRQLQGVRWNWKADGKPDAGVIAQDVEKVMPELVVQDSITGFKAVRYQGLIAPLVQSVKQLDIQCQMSKEQSDVLAQKIKNHEDRINQLERKMASVEAENKELKTILSDLIKKVEKLEKNSK